MKKILIPIDFSEVSEHAIDFAILLAEKQGAEVTLMHSINLQYFAEFRYSFNEHVRNAIGEVEDEVNEKMDGIINSLTTSVQVSKHIVKGNLIKEIEHLTSEDGFDLVVVGTSGSHGWDEVWVGSNTEKIVRRISKPVIAVPASSKVKDVKKILVPIDIREVRKGFIHELATLQRRFEAHIELVWVKTPHNVEDEEQLTGELAALLRENSLDHFSMTIITEVFPSDGILKYAKETKADMLAMATHARRGISHWLSGSLTEDTLNHIDIPVWTFRLNRDEKPFKLESVVNAKGTPIYRQIKVPMK